MIYMNCHNQWYKSKYIICVDESKGWICLNLQINRLTDLKASVRWLVSNRKKFTFYMDYVTILIFIYQLFIKSNTATLVA